jgi:hypothetical protein
VLWVITDASMESAAFKTEMKIELTGSYEMSVTTYTRSNMRYHNPGDHNLDLTILFLMRNPTIYLRYTRFHKILFCLR